MISRQRAEQIALDNYGSIYAFCLSLLKSEQEAQDITQDVFLYMQTECERLEDNNLRAWLYGVARNKVFECYRERKEAQNFVPLESDSVAALTEEPLIPPDDFPPVLTEDRLLGMLTPEQRELYRMLYIPGGCKPDEAAARLGISRNALDVRKFRLKRVIHRLIRVYCNE